MQKQPSKMFLGKGVLKICSKFTGEHPCRSVISIKLLCQFIEIALRHGCSPVNLLNIFTTPFYKNTSGGRLLSISHKIIAIIDLIGFPCVLRPSQTSMMDSFAKIVNSFSCLTVFAEKLQMLDA